MLEKKSKMMDNTENKSYLL